MLIAVVGPTATGKSALGVALARALDPPGEVVNADAFQLYRGMDIGTAKVTAAERGEVPHHQIDVLDVAEDASVAHFQTAARTDVADIESRGRRAILVGGSGLYVRSVLDRIEFPGTDPKIRGALEARAEAEGARSLHDELTRRDPVAAANIGPGNVKRTVRALEVIELTGRPFSATLPVPEYVRPTVQIGLDCSRAVLDARVEARVAKMWEQGLVAEVAALADHGMGRTAARAVGYAEVLEMLVGRCTEAVAREAVVVHTRRLARKQMGWFGRDPRIVWLDADAPDLVAQALDVVARAERGELDLPDASHRTRRTLGS